MNCAELEALAAELALGTVSGAERAGALDHLAGCPACRTLVEELAGVADRMLLLAPVIQPPPGFESKVLARMGVAPARDARPPRYRRLLVGVAAVALVAGLCRRGVVGRRGRAPGRGPHRPRRRQRRPLEVPGRRLRREAHLARRESRPDGRVEQLLLGGGAARRQLFAVPVGSFALDQGHGTLARPLDLPAGDLESVRVLDSSGRVRYVMTFDDDDDD